MKSGRLFIAIVSSLLDEAIIIAIIIFGLPRLGLNIPTFGIIIIAIGFLIYATTLYILGSRTLGKRPVAGFTSMQGMEGRVVCQLNPQGVVKIKGELWEAKTEADKIGPGEDVIVTGQDRLKLTVKRK